MQLPCLCELLPCVSRAYGWCGACRYGDYETSPLGVQYKDFREGSGEGPR